MVEMRLRGLNLFCLAAELAAASSIDGTWISEMRDCDMLSVGPQVDYKNFGRDGFLECGEFHLAGNQRLRPGVESSLEKKIDIGNSSLAPRR
jgi:hypothetical protein